MHCAAYRNGPWGPVMGLAKKDIGGIVGLHHPVLQAGFDEESGAIKVPHAAHGMEGEDRQRE